jgi:hypothetical protein
MSRWRALVPHLIGPAALAVLSILFFWKLVLVNQYTWLEGPDHAYMVMPWFQFEAGEWHQGRFPLWDPYGWAGQPLLAQAQPGAAYPLNWLVFAAPLQNGWVRQATLHWYFVLIHFLGALAAYWFARDLGRSRIASVAAGCVYGFGGYMGGVTWPQMLNGAPWIPLVLLFLFRVERAVRPLASALFSGFFLGLMWLAGHHQIQVFTSIAAGAMWLWLSVRKGRVDTWILRLGLLSLSFAVLTSAFQTLPTAEYGRASVRWSGVDEPLRFDQRVPYNVHGQYSLKPEQLFGVFLPVLNGGYDPFVGVIGLLLAGFGLATHWREPWARWLAAIGAAALLVALGPNSLLHGVLYALVPLVEKVRVPASAVALFCAAASPLVAAGFDALRDAPRNAAVRWVVWVAAAVGVLFGIASLGFYLAKVHIEISDGRLTMAALFAGSLAVLVAARASKQIGWRALSVILVGLILTELANETGFWWPNISDKSRTSYLKELTKYADVVEFVRSKGEPVRIEYDSELIKPNIGLWYGIPTFESYVASVPSDLWRHDLFNGRTRDFFGINYLFAAKPRRPEQIEVFKGKDGVNVYSNPGAYPRAWAVHEATTLGSDREGVARMTEPQFDPRRSTFLVKDAAPLLEQCEGDQVEIKAYQPNSVELSADMKCRGMVILTDTWFPGWKVTVDGKPAPLYQAYAMVRGVAVDAGRHTIQMKYRPRSVAIGAVMSATAMALVVFVALRQKLREA